MRRLVLIAVIAGCSAASPEDGPTVDRDDGVREVERFVWERKTEQ